MTYYMLYCDGIPRYGLNRSQKDPQMSITCICKLEVASMGHSEAWEGQQSGSLAWCNLEEASRASQEGITMVVMAHQHLVVAQHMNLQPTATHDMTCNLRNWSRFLFGLFLFFLSGYKNNTQLGFGGASG